MLIQIRGTMGSGKSYIMRQVMADLGQSTLTYKMLQGERWCIGHHFPSRDIFVVGHYDNSTWSGADKFFGISKHLKNPKSAVSDLLRNCVQDYRLVLFECVHALAWNEQFQELSGLTKFLAIQLTTPVEVCLESLGERRAGAAKGRRSATPVSEKTADAVKSFYRRSWDNSEELADNDLDVLYLDRKEALAKVREVIK